MSMSDCIQCWNTPCTCGWDYRNASTPYVEKMQKMFSKILEFRELYPDAKLSPNCLHGLSEDDKKFMRHVGIL